MQTLQTKPAAETKSVNSSQQFFAPVQPQLTVNRPNDVYEQEADAIADKVMRTTAPQSGAAGFFKPTPLPVQLKCAHCEEEEKKAQRKEQGETNTTAPGSLQQYTSGLRGKGTSLPPQARQFFASRMGYDFSNVKVHTDEAAAKSAQSINALAYTSGPDIVFNKGQYQPGTDTGKRLLAHELTHVVQQGHGALPATVQRTIGDGHDLVAARFSGNATLEAVYDNERLLQKGAKSAAVRVIQQALLDAGMSLPRFGADGDFGSETEAAVIEFQRASGLNGTDRDGVIGPTTMGWLDQRFADTATPAGTSAGATTGCTAFKTINVAFLSLRGSNRNPNEDLEFANSVFNQCCVKFNAVQGSSVTDDVSDNLLGGDTTLARTPACGSLTADEGNLVNNGGLSARFRVYYVENIDTVSTAYSMPPFCATGSAAAASETAFVSNGAFKRSLAHEFGHILLNNGDHPADNLMEPSPGTSEDLTDTQCATIFANA